VRIGLIDNEELEFVAALRAPRRCLLGRDPDARLAGGRFAQAWWRVVCSTIAEAETGYRGCLGRSPLRCRF
jgi:hypothetical protein